MVSGQPVTLSVNSVADYNYQWKKGGAALSGQTAGGLVITAQGDTTAEGVRRQ